MMGRGQFAISGSDYRAIQNGPFGTACPWPCCTQQRILFMLIQHCWCCADGSGEAAGGGAVAGRKAVDFENLAFAQGNHLMTNKKCDLPQKSYRAAHKVTKTTLAAVPSPALVSH